MPKYNEVQNDFKTKEHIGDAVWKVAACEVIHDTREDFELNRKYVDIICSNVVMGDIAFSIGMCKNAFDPTEKSEKYLANALEYRIGNEYVENGLLAAVDEAKTIILGYLHDMGFRMMKVYQNDQSIHTLPYYMPEVNKLKEKIKGIL